MKVVHWSMHNGSGMNNVAQSMVDAERKLGIDAILANPFQDDEKWNACLDADVHVDHTHVPESFRRRVKKDYKTVYVAHGTPEHVFQTAVEVGEHKGYGAGDSLMLMFHGLKRADAVVTFWSRHAALYETMVDKGRKIHCIPLGVDKSFWCPGTSRGKFAGEPSVLTAENCHLIKWPLDIFLTWPMVYPRVNGNPSLHAAYLPMDKHRWFFPLVYNNGCAYGSHITALTFCHEDLRNAFRSVDYYLGFVRYGDFNRVCLEARATGAKLISYRGNPYAHYWVTEGDQRVMAQELINILNGKTTSRVPDAVPDASETAAAMKEVYESVL